MNDKFDLFGVLARLDLNQFDWIESKDLTRVAGWMLPQWMCGAQDERSHRELIHRFNTVNRGWFAHSNRPYLQLKLLAAIALGRRVKHRFYKAAPASTLNKLATFLESVIPGWRSEEIRLYCRCTGLEDFRRLARLHGVQAKDMEELENEYARARSDLRAV